MLNNHCKSLKILYLYPKLQTIREIIRKKSLRYEYKQGEYKHNLGWSINNANTWQVELHEIKMKYVCNNIWQ